MRVLRVVRREFLERVRTKAFVIGTVLGPVLLVGLTVVPGLLMSKAGKPLKVAVLDEDGALGTPVRAALSAAKVAGNLRFTVQDVPGDRKALDVEVLAGRLDGYLVLPKGALDSAQAEYYAKNVSNLPDQRLMDNAVEQAFVKLRLAVEGLPADKLDAVTRRLDLKTLQVTKEGSREDKGAGFIISFVMLMILYTSMLMWGQAVLSSVIEEKSNRVLEVMVSSISPAELFAGKIVGVGAASLTQFLVWTAAGIGASLYAGSFATGLNLPSLGPLVWICFVVFFLLGYFLYSAMYAAIGACVNTLQEAQNLMFPVMLPIIGAMVSFPIIMRDPDGTLSVVLSLLPPLAPLLMFLRVATVPTPLWQIGLSIVLLLLAIGFVNWVAARIYRVGILMYGKRPTFPEMLRWVRHR
ncbi:MAG: ABC transporter permease [Vicinamibacteria bacterium]|jgi:ABC-2 type transport system permease protein|nr:ABC transporter permease [Vicinamibacteria bacterium]